MPQYELNLRDYWQIIIKRRAVLSTIFSFVLLGSILYTRTLAPLYKASATIMIRQFQSVGTLLLELTGSPIGDPMLSYARSINSLTILEEAVRQLGIAGIDPDPEEVTKIASSLQGAVDTRIEPDTNIIVITATLQDRVLTAKLANKIAEVFISENLKENSKQARKTREFIEGQLSDLEKKLMGSEDVLKQFKEKEAPSGIAVGLQQKLSVLETEKSKLTKIYTERHPDIININEQIEEIRFQMKDLPETELNYARLMREVEINDAIYRELKAKLESARIAESEKVEDVSLVEPALAPNLPVSPKKAFNYLLGALIGLMLGLTGAFLSEQLDTSIGTIEDVEDFLQLPALGIIPYLRVKEDRKGIRRFLPKKLEGKEKLSHLRKQLVVHYSSTSPIFESYRMLRTNIQNEVKKEEAKGKTIMISSSGPEEGKSITISNLAIAMAQGNLRTLLIDADMRRSVIHNLFGLKRDPGLSNILRGVSKPEDAIKTFADILMGEMGFDEALKLPGLDNLSILTSGSLPSLPSELLSSSDTAALLEKLKERFDLILIDSPPVLAVADATILSSRVDAVILVYRVGKTARSALARAKTQLVDSGAQVKGVVLNNISPELEMRYGYHYHYKYYGKYYTSTDKETKG